MFHKVNAKQLKRKLLLKYFFQFLIAPMLIGTIIDVCFLFVAVIRWRSNGLYRFFINEPFYLIGYIMGYMAIFITNVFSIITAIKLIVDKDNPKKCTIKWIRTISGQFELSYGKYSKTIIVESLF